MLPGAKAQPAAQRRTQALKCSFLQQKFVHKWTSNGGRTARRAPDERRGPRQ
jgi:hypothetical protein